MFLCEQLFKLKSIFKHTENAERTFIRQVGSIVFSLEKEIIHADDDDT